MAQLYPQALATHFSRLLQNAWAIVEPFFNPGHHMGAYYHQPPFISNAKYFLQNLICLMTETWLACYQEVMGLIPGFSKILKVNKVFINQKKINVCEHTVKVAPCDNYKLSVFASLTDSSEDC